MKIKALIDFLNKEGNQARTVGEMDDSAPSHETLRRENVIYIDNGGQETVIEGVAVGKELLDGGARWSDQSMGDLLVAQGKLTKSDIDKILDYQRDKGIYFGEAAIDLKLVSQDDILQALSRQFGYSYGQGESTPSREMVMASIPFGDLAEEFRSIRGKLISNWLTPNSKKLAIVSPESKDGRSYVASNLALAFSQLEYSTLLIDADLRTPRQHEIFRITRRVGLSTLLAGRVRVEDLDLIPNSVPGFPYLSVLGCGVVPPNPAELLGSRRLPLIMHELEKYFDVIIIDCPMGSYQADIISIGSVAENALLVARSAHTKINDTKLLISNLVHARARVVGAVLNQY